MLRLVQKLTVLSLFISSSVFAATTATSTPTEGETKLKIEDVSGKKNKVEGDIDQEITNAKLRAESGSKSKLSLSIKTAYTGGSLQSAFGAHRPQLAADPSTQDFTSLDIGMDARYRWTKNDSVTVGTKFGFVTPFQGRVSKNNALNVNDPTIAYSRVAKWGGLQAITSVGYGYGTSIKSTQNDTTHQPYASLNLMKSFGNGISFGSSISSGYNFYDSKPGENKNTRSAAYGGDRRVEWSLGIFPQAEYQINDKLAVRTVFGYFNWKHVYGDRNNFRLLQTYVYQSVGIGWSVARDIYLYPNIQFVPDNIRSDFTNVALSATINVF